MGTEKMVSEKRDYQVLNTEEAKDIVSTYLDTHGLARSQICFGLPEIYDRYDIWNVPLMYKNNFIGEISVDAFTSEISKKHSSDLEMIKKRIDGVDISHDESMNKVRKQKDEYTLSTLNNLVIKGWSEVVLSNLPEQSIDLVFTSPPYFNARKEYSEYATYNDYLEMIRDVICESRRVLIDGKFLVINTSHVLIPRATRNESSRRIAVPFDIHQIVTEEGFEFIDDIIWQKPEGAGWASGRGRRFAADRNPLQYKAVPVTEYVMVYRKKPAALIDYFIRNHPNQEVIEKSKIPDGYEKTNVWYISPSRDRRHPAVFPIELAEKVISYYSFYNDVVLDPFGGIGTTAKAARKLGRRFVTIDVSDEYIEATLDDLGYKQVTFNDESNFEYYDWHDKEKPTHEKKRLDDLISRLRASGISENSIWDALEKLLK